MPRLLSPRTAILAVLAAAVSSAAASHANADVVFSNIYTDAANTGFFDPTLGASRQAAWSYAESIWANVLASTYTSGTETITVSASFSNLGGNSTSAVVGSAYANTAHYNFTSASPKYQANTLYVGALANHLAGTNLDAPGTAQIAASFNSNIDSGTVIGGRTFYYGTDGNPSLTPPSQIDFVTVALHELAHGLGFVATISALGGFQNGYALPDAFDRFLYRSSTDAYLTTYDDDYSGNLQRSRDIVSRDLYFRSPTTIALDGPNGAKLYAPSGYVSGSSVSHIDPSILDPMNPSYSIVQHTPTANDLAILSDIGWDISVPIPEPASLALLTLALPLLITRRRPA